IRRCNAEGRNLLIEVVVEFPCQPFPLILLCPDQARRQSPHFLLLTLALRDIDHGTGETEKFSGSRKPWYALIEHPAKLAVGPLNAKLVAIGTSRQHTFQKPCARGGGIVGMQIVGPRPA